MLLRTEQCLKDVAFLVMLPIKKHLRAEPEKEKNIMETVNKKEFAYKIAGQGGFYKKDAVKMVELFWDTLMDYLEEGKKVNFYGIGHYEMKTVKGREARKGGRNEN